MKIEEKENIIYDFMDIEPGDGFMYNRYLFMKTDGCLSYNAVDLNSGQLSFFGGTIKVIPVDVTCTYKKKDVE